MNPEFHREKGEIYVKRQCFNIYQKSNFKMKGMFIMKKIIILLLAIFMLLNLVACGEDESVNKEPSVEGTEMEDENSTENDYNNEEENDDMAKITMADVMDHPESSASDFFCNDDGEGGLIILEYLGDDEIVVIPEEIDGKNVTKINKYVFANDSCVKGIKLSSTIKEIDAYVFGLNVNLQYVILGAGVEIIGEAAFMGCTALKEITINDGVKSIKSLAFSKCTALKSVILPETVEIIEMKAFSMMADEFKIIGKAGSVAEAYANSESITFEAE